MMRSNAFSNQFPFTEQETGLDRLARAALDFMGTEPIPWYWSYHVRIAVK